MKIWNKQIHEINNIPTFINGELNYLFSNHTSSDNLYCEKIDGNVSISTNDLKHSLVNFYVGVWYQVSSIIAVLNQFFFQVSSLFYMMFLAFTGLYLNLYYPEDFQIPQLLLLKEAWKI